jgi:alkylated DNA repair dioxygenase AlkB
MVRGDLLPHHGYAVLNPDFLSPVEADALFGALLTGCEWKQQPVVIFGKKVLQPRLTVAFADEGVVYRYSGTELFQHKWTESLAVLKRRVEEFSGHTFNTALLNLYRDGRDSMGWHRDNERVLGDSPFIASVSLGAVRKFQFREYKTKSDLISVEPPHGSLMLMGGECQQFWEHRVPKTTARVGERINLTFRSVTEVASPHRNIGT